MDTWLNQLQGRLGNGLAKHSEQWENGFVKKLAVSPFRLYLKWLVLSKCSLSIAEKGDSPKNF